MTTKVISTMTSGIVEDTDKASATPVALSTGAAGDVIQLDAAGALPELYMNQHVTQWRLIADFAIGTGENVVSNTWEEVDTSTQARVGSAMTIDEGVFTFPKTGIWLIRFYGVVAKNTGDVSNIVADLFGTTDSGGSTEMRLASTHSGVSSKQAFSSLSLESIFDVLNTTNNKVKIKMSAISSGADLLSHTSFNKTYLTFQYVGPKAA